MKQDKDIAEFKGETEDEIIEIRDISDEEAREEILKLLLDGKEVVYLSDIIDRLKLDLEQAHRVCLELIDEEKVYVPEE